MYQDRLQQEGIQHVVNTVKLKFKPNDYLVDQVYSILYHNLINNQKSYYQSGNDEIAWAKYPNESDSEEGETNTTSTLPNFMPQWLPDHEVPEGRNHLN